MVTTIAEHRMSDLEALLWRSGQPSGISLLMMLDGAPGWDRLRITHEWATRIVRRTRERVLEPALPVGPPAWVPDDDFDLSHHLRRVRLPGPGGQAELFAFVQDATAAPLDRDRPLWEGTLVEGLAHGRAAYLLRVHQSLTDGLGDVPLASLMQSHRPEHTHGKPVASPHPETIRLDPRSLALADLTRQALTLPLATGRLLAAGARTLTHPGPAAADALRLAVSLRRAASGSVAGSPLFHGHDGTSWRFGLLECALDDLRAAGRAFGGSEIDVYLAAMLGGMRRYHERHGIELDEMPMTMPVGPRGPGHEPAGGRVGSAFAAPVGIEDPAERIAAVRGLTMTLRVDSTRDGFTALAPLLNRFPTAVGTAAHLISAAADLSVSYRLGAPCPTYLAGAKVERVYPLGPTPSSAVTAAMQSQDGTCCLGLTMDGTVVPDPDVLVECVGAGLEEVLTLG
jgi:diacylglycerol O-acyltransferase